MTEPGVVATGSLAPRNTRACTALEMECKGIEKILATMISDNRTRELLESILVDEKDPIDWMEAQQDQIAQMGIENHLAQKIGE